MQAQNLLNEFLQYELKTITEHKIKIVSTQYRAAQDDLMLYECIINSFSVEGKGKLTYTKNTTWLITFHYACVYLRC